MSTLKMTLQTIRRLQNGVLVADLAPTLRDAIEVTLHLGVDLLWIDALCILQGDAADWEEESAKMADIYGGAFLVIQAASCSSVTDSFLNHVRDSIITLDEKLNIKARRVNTFGHHGRVLDRVADPIDCRAWTLQEKILSTRALRYSATEVQWNCSTERSCECGQPPVDDAQYIYSYRSLLSRFSGDPTQAWDKLVNDYSSRSLTHDDDILPAISGISRRIAVEIKSQYVTGLWIGSAPLCLLWRVHSFSEPFPAFDRVYIRILSTKCCLASFDPFGKITAASLEIQGMLLPAVLDIYGPDDKLYVCGAGSGFIFELDGPILKDESRSGVTARRAKLATAAKVEMKGIPVHFWPLVSKESGCYCEVYGLILGRSSSTLGDGYERLGFARKWLREAEFEHPKETRFQIF
jgi:hypothetical protein